MGDARSGRPTSHRAFVGAVVAAAGFGVIVRAWIVAGRLGAVNSDEAISGLLAARIAAGEFTTFFWGQSYGGTLEAYAMGAVFRLLPGDSVTFLLVPILEAVAICALTGLIVHRRLGTAAGWLAAAVVWVFPTAFVLFSTRPMLFYQPTTILGLGAVLMTQYLLAAPSGRVWRWAVLGGLLGLGWWTSPQIVFFAVPCLVALGRGVVDPVTRPTRWAVPLLAAAGVVGALPWLRANVGAGWPSLDPVPGDGGSYLDHLHAQITRGFPMALGLRVPYTEQWIVSGAGRVFGLSAIVIGVGGLVAAARNRRIVGVLVGGLAVFPLVHALGPTSGFVGTGRYYSFLAPAMAAVVAGAVRRPAARAIVLVVMMGVTVVGFVGLRDISVASEDTGPLIAELEAQGIRDVYSSFWISYKLTWESAEQVVAAPDAFDRYPPYAARVRASPRVAYVFWIPFDPDAAWRDRVVAGLDADGVGWTEQTVGGYSIVVPDRNVPPESLGTD